jgi:hypothetical protein
MSAFDAVAAQDYELLLPRPVLDPELNGSCSTRFDLDYILHLTSLLKSTHTGEADYRPSFESSETCPSPSADLIQRLATELRTWSEDIRKLRDEQAACMVQAVQDVRTIPSIRCSYQEITRAMQWLDIAPRSHPFRSAALCLVVKIAASSEKLPSSLFLPDVKLESRDSFFGGGFADIYRGMYEGHKVAIKKPRALSAVSNPYAVSLKFGRYVGLVDERWQRLCREALIWYQLRHPFVLPFIGVDRDNFEATNLVGLVTPWISPGTLKDVMKSDRFDAEIDPYVWVCLSRWAVAEDDSDGTYHIARRDSTRSGLLARRKCCAWRPQRCTYSTQVPRLVVPLNGLRYSGQHPDHRRETRSDR